LHILQSLGRKDLQEQWSAHRRCPLVNRHVAPLNTLPLARCGVVVGGTVLVRPTCSTYLLALLHEPATQRRRREPGAGRSTSKGSKREQREQPGRLDGPRRSRLPAPFLLWLLLVPRRPPKFLGPRRNRWAMGLHMENAPPPSRPGELSRSSS
jgi:hypothetical protein